MADDLDLTRFLSAYTVDTEFGAPRSEPIIGSEGSSGPTDQLHQLLAQIGGMSFTDGSYRLLSLADVSGWTATIATAWAETAGRVSVCAYDWLGRLFALYKDSIVLQFSAGDLEFTEIPTDLAGFHNEELVDFRQEVLAYEFYQAWVHSGGARPHYRQCIGHRTPLFLGGPDEVENLEAIDLDVYWSVSAPVIARARKPGVGGVIGKIEIGE